jgi:hypothetical protein
LNPGERTTQYWQIKPNPWWEEITCSFYGPAGGGVYLDHFYVSTACVPEPTSILALGSGLMGLLGLRIRKRR